MDIYVLLIDNDSGDHYAVGYMDHVPNDIEKQRLLSKEYLADDGWDARLADGATPLEVLAAWRTAEDTLTLTVELVKQIQLYPIDDIGAPDPDMVEEVITFFSEKAKTKIKPDDYAMAIDQIHLSNYLKFITDYDVYFDGVDLVDGKTSKTLVYDALGSTSPRTVQDLYDAIELVK